MHHDKPRPSSKDASYDMATRTWTYRVVALQIPTVFNKHRDHDPEGLMYALAGNRSELERYAADLRQCLRQSQKLTAEKENDSWVASLSSALHDDQCACSGHEGEEARVGDELHIEQKFKVHDLVRPLVLRAAVGDRVEIRFQNYIHCRSVGMHLVGPGSKASNDGSHVGGNESSLAPPYPGLGLEAQELVYRWHCEHEGAFLLHDMGDPGGDENGTNAHGLFGALIVEPDGAWWTDSRVDYRSPNAPVADGLYVDVHFKAAHEYKDAHRIPFADPDKGNRPSKYREPQQSFREYVLFIHDEPEAWELHPRTQGHCVSPVMDGLYLGEKEEALKAQLDTLKDDYKPVERDRWLQMEPHGGSLMCFNYRSEPMKNREMKLWEWLREDKIRKTVINEDQHHSSWLFGDPDTPVLKAYLGDPIRIHVLHPGAKETHVFHLHVYEWHAEPKDRSSPLIDAFTISPGTASTMEVLFGAGNVQAVPGDVIWHCHLYPHFHMGMWGLLRTFDKLQSGVKGPLIKTGEHLPVDGQRVFEDLTPNYNGRFIGQYPDGTPIERLAVLPDREPPPKPTPEQPGFPLFIPGEIRQKSPLPPWPDFKPRRDQEDPAAEDFDYREPTCMEMRAMNRAPKPGELFTTFPHPDKRCLWEPNAQAPSLVTRHDKLSRVAHDITVGRGLIKYNSHNWHDPDGHFYYFGKPVTKPKATEPLFFRARQGDVLNLTFSNKIGFCNPKPAPKLVSMKLIKADLTRARVAKANPVASRGYPNYVCGVAFNQEEKGQEKAEVKGSAPDSAQYPSPSPKGGQPGHGGQIERGFFDLNIPPGDALLRPINSPAPAECGLHVHLVKFDPICADGASSGWNYLSAPSNGKKMVYRWWCDEEFGTIFFHDHLFANTRQRHGLYGALIVEPEGSRFLDPLNKNKVLTNGVGSRAVIERLDGSCYREFCIGVGDWIAMYDRENKPLSGPDEPSSHGDNGTMCVNYHSQPMPEQGGRPHTWFDVPHKDLVFESFANEPLVIRLIQGSHEEQHSFNLHGMRWHAAYRNALSPWRNQQTLGISEAFSFKIGEPYAAGDYLWRFAGQEDTWLGCWGLLRVYPRPAAEHVPKGGELWPIKPSSDQAPELPPLDELRCRRYRIKAKKEAICYRSKPGDELGLMDRQGERWLVTECAGPGEAWVAVPESETVEPMVIRAQQGDWVIIEASNALPAALKAEKYWPELSVSDERPEAGNRAIDAAVSLDAAQLERFVWIGGQWQPANAPRSAYAIQPGATLKIALRAHDEPGAILLQDMADLRHHRHHGLFGALVIIPANTIPLHVPRTASSAPEYVKGASPQAWTGTRATVFCQDDGSRHEEMVLFLHDGIRFVHDAKWKLTNKPEEGPHPADIPGDPGEEGPDSEDQGHKAFNYRSARLDKAFASRIGCGEGAELPEVEEPSLLDHTISQRRGWFTDPPATPIIRVHRNSNLSLHLVCAADKPRNHSFTIHGHQWEKCSHLGTNSPVVSSEGGISCGTVRHYQLKANDEAGDYLYRSGVFKWAIAQGLWGILRVTEDRLSSELSPNTEDAGGGH